MLEERLGRLPIPVVTGGKFGHATAHAPLPYGTLAELDTRQRHAGRAGGRGQLTASAQLTDRVLGSRDVLDLAEALLVPLDVGLQRPQQALGVARRRQDARPHPGLRRRRLQEGEVQDELGVGVVDEHQVAYRPWAVASSRSTWICWEPGGGFGASDGGMPVVLPIARSRQAMLFFRLCSSFAMTRVVGIDLGSRRIGVAVSDGLGLTAQPHATIARHGGLRDLEAIAQVVRAVGADRVVLGLPLDPEGRRATPPAAPAPSPTSWPPTWRCRSS